MVAFASLFLALILGVHQVEVVVGDGVASVELRLDGERLGILRQAPWVLPCDFGSELAPQHLEAVAYDAQDRELSRVSQWLNLPQPQAITSVVLEPRETGKPRVAQVSWQSSVGAEPESVKATFDGEPIVVSNPRRIVLPTADESQLHLLQIELNFEDHVTSRVDFTFGGAYVDEVSTEITALALRATQPTRRPPTADQVQGWFVKDGEALRVIAVEKETAEIVLVMGRPFPRFTLPGEPVKIPKSLQLSGDQRLRFVFPVPSQTQGVDVTFDLFPVTQAFDGGLGDLYSLLTRIRDQPRDNPPRITSAVSIAGRVAYEGRHRRIVILVPSSDPDKDVSSFAPDLVRRYLERLRVPFVVWDPESKTSERLAAWGDVRKVGSMKQLAAAFKDVSGLLAEQWMVWLDGRHLPQDIELSTKASGFTLLH